MAYIVLLSVILLSSTISLGEEISPLELCIIGMSSHYSNVSQYCTLHLIQNNAKADVCKETLQLFNKMCSFKISATAFHKPEPQTVSKENCVPLCAEVDAHYISRMLDGGTGSCKTLCTKDLEAVAVLSTLFQLKDFIAGLKEKEKQLVETVTNSTLEELQQSTSSSGAVVNASIEPNAKPTTAAVVNASIEPNTKPTNAAVVNASIEPNTKPTTAAVVNAPIEPNRKPTTAELVSKKELVATARSSTVQLQQSSSTKEVTKERMVPPTKPGVNTVTTAAMHPSSTKATEKSTTATDATVKKTTLDVKPTITAEGENDSSTNKADITLKPVITVATEKNPATNVKPTTTVTKERMDTVTTEHEEDLFKNDNSDELDNNDEKLSFSKDTHSKTDEKDETSRLDDTPSSYHFLIYFLAFIVLCVAAYIVFHNKHKIIGFIIEGKQGRRGGRPSTKQYTPLKSKVEDVMPFIEKSTTQSNYIY